MDEDIPQDELLEFAKSENKELRVAALHRLLGYKNPTAICEVALLLLNPDRCKELSNSQFGDLAWTLELEASCVSLDLANRLASSPNAKVQRIGVRILKEVGDSSSIPILIQVLDAKNIDTQISAIVALGRITGKKGPSWDEFRKNPSAETQKWKTWWQKKNSTNNISNKTL
jgi:HEAT repeat protein